MQDCDARIAIYAARALSAEDITTLQVANKQLALAAETYSNFKLHDQTRFAATVHGRLEHLIARLKEAHGSSNALELAEQAQPNGKAGWSMARKAAAKPATPAQSPTPSA